MKIKLEDLHHEITENVRIALAEDIGRGDITAQLIPETQESQATIITREACTLCGIAWAEETFKQLGGLNKIEWHIQEGEQVAANTPLVTLQGNSRTLLTGERTALNFLQLLCAVASKARRYADTLPPNSQLKILDTRKTIPGLRLAQKYAVTVGGCHNHRIGLYDAFLIKENHIAACGGIRQAVEKAREIAPSKKVEVETETLEELKEAIEAGADVAMLDNFSEDMLKQAFQLDRNSTEFEVSGNLTQERLNSLHETPTHYCSFGDLTKSVEAVDLSMRIN